MSTLPWALVRLDVGVSGDGRVHCDAAVLEGLGVERLGVRADGYVLVRCPVASVDQVLCEYGVRGYNAVVLEGCVAVRVDGSLLRGWVEGRRELFVVRGLDFEWVVLGADQARALASECYLVRCMCGMALGWNGGGVVAGGVQ